MKPFKDHVGTIPEVGTREDIQQFIHEQRSEDEDDPAVPVKLPPSEPKPDCHSCKNLGNWDKGDGPFLGCDHPENSERLAPDALLILVVDHPEVGCLHHEVKNA